MCSVQDIVKSLEGDYREEHLFALKQGVELYNFYHQKIEACDRQKENCLAQFDSKVDIKTNPVPPSKKRNSGSGKLIPHNQSQFLFDIGIYHIRARTEALMRKPWKIHFQS